MNFPFLFFPSLRVVAINCSYSWGVKLSLNSSSRDEVLPKASPVFDSKWKWPESDGSDSTTADDSSDDLSDEDDIFYDSDAPVVEPVATIPQQQQQQQQPSFQDEE